MIYFAGEQISSPPGCTDFVHPHVGYLYTGVYKCPTPGSTKNLATRKKIIQP